MVKLTQSLEHWMCEKGYLKEMTLLTFGHTEYLTDEMWDEYIEWCKTEDGKQYLKGGSKYMENYNER